MRKIVRRIIMRQKGISPWIFVLFPLPMLKLKPDPYLLLSGLPEWIQFKNQKVTKNT